MTDKDQIVESFLASDKIDDMQSYLSPGRCFRSLDETALKGRWIVVWGGLLDPAELSETELKGVTAKNSSCSDDTVYRALKDLGFSHVSAPADLGSFFPRAPIQHRGDRQQSPRIDHDAKCVRF